MTAVAQRKAAPAPAPPAVVEDSGETLLKLTDVERITTLGKTKIYEQIKEGAFPKPRKIGDFCSRWLRSDIVAWMRKLPTE